MPMIVVGHALYTERVFDRWAITRAFLLALEGTDPWVADAIVDAAEDDCFGTAKHRQSARYGWGHYR